MIVAILDEELRFSFVSMVIAPLEMSDVLGTYPWDYVSPADAEVSQVNLRECLETGESRVYWARYSVGGEELVFRVKASRVPTGVVCVSYILPVAAMSLTENELQLMRDISFGSKQESSASHADVNQSTISRRRAALQRKLGATDRHTLLVIAIALR